MKNVIVIGAGLAGCEAAYQLANLGFCVKLYEMKKIKRHDAFKTDKFAELICSNSLRSDNIENAVGLLKEEMRCLDSLIMEAADATKVDAGSSLAVDRHMFSDYITAKIYAHPNIEVIDGGIDNDNIEEAQSQAAAVLAANPDLVGYLNCDACGSGVAAAIEEAGKQGQVKFVAMDNLIEILDYIPDTITATSSTLPQMQGQYAVLMMWQAHLGLDIPQAVDTGIAVIDETNIDEWKEIVGGK